MIITSLSFDEARTVIGALNQYGTHAQAIAVQLSQEGATIEGRNPTTSEIDAIKAEADRVLRLQKRLQDALSVMAPT
ncbi:MAG: hypothetical protein WCC36_04280 [Gammaproteobacteria bacterium]